MKTQLSRIVLWLHLVKLSCADIGLNTWDKVNSLKGTFKLEYTSKEALQNIDYML